MISNANKRRETTARQIEAAMERKGLTRSQLAKAMGRNRSEVTKWLGGNHCIESIRHNETRIKIELIILVRSHMD